MVTRYKASGTLRSQAKTANNAGGIRWCAAALFLCVALFASRADAASSAGCEGGGFTLLLPGGSTISGNLTTTIPAGQVGASIQVLGKYVEFKIISSTFGVEDYTLTGVANSLDITRGQRTIVFASKTPDLRGAALTSDVVLELKDESIVIQRTGPGVSMKIQAF